MLTLIASENSPGFAVASLGLPPPISGAGQSTLLCGLRRNAIRVSRDARATGEEFDPHELAGMRRLWLAVINQAVMDGDVEWFGTGYFRHACELAGFEPAWVSAGAHNKLRKYVGVVAARRARALAHKART